MLRKQRAFSIHFDRPSDYIYRPDERIVGRFFREKDDDADVELRYAFVGSCAVQTAGNRLSDRFDIFACSGAFTLSKSERTLFFDFCIPARFNGNASEPPILKQLDGTVHRPTDNAWDSQVDKAPPTAHLRADGNKCDISYTVSVAPARDSESRRRSIFKRENDESTSAEVAFATDQGYNWTSPAIAQHDQMLKVALWYDQEFRHFDVQWHATLPLRIVLGESLAIKWTLDGADLPIGALDELKGAAQLSLAAHMCCHWGKCSEVDLATHKANTVFFRKWIQHFAHGGKDLYTKLNHEFSAGVLSEIELGPSFESKISRQYLLTLSITMDGKKNAGGGFKYTSQNTRGWFQQPVVILPKVCKPDWVQTPTLRDGLTMDTDALPAYSGTDANNPEGLPDYEVSPTATSSAQPSYDSAMRQRQSEAVPDAERNENREAE